MEGQSFITINPDTLNDSRLWSYRDLQKIGRAVGIKANGSREIIVERLQSWNRMRIDGTKTVVEDHHHIAETASSDEFPQTEHLEMNVVGNNFSILAVHVKSHEDHSSSMKIRHYYSTTREIPPKVKKSSKSSLMFSFKSKRKSSRRSIIGFFNPDAVSNTRRTSVNAQGSNGSSGTISPSYLRPLRSEPATPGKSCLKKHSRYGDGANGCGKRIERSPLTDLYQNHANIINIPKPQIDELVHKPFFKSSDSKQPLDDIRSPSVKRLTNICFSPFNGVRIIAHRVEDEDEDDDDDDEDDDSDEDEDENCAEVEEEDEPMYSSVHNEH